MIAAWCGLEKLRQMERGWDSLAARGASPMQLYAWTEAFAETFGDAGGLRVVTVGGDDSPRALAALVSPRGVQGALESLSVKQLFEPMDFLYEDESSLEALARGLRAQGDALYLPRIPADSAVVRALRSAYAGGLVRVAKTDGYPVLELDAAWQAPERCLSPGRRSDFRRARRRAECSGQVTLEILAPGEQELPGLLDEAWRVEAAGWKGQRGSALSCDRSRGAFFRRFAASACRKGFLRLAFMRIGGQAVAMQFAAECDSRLWLLKIGYDERYAFCSPGQQLMLYVAGEAARRGLQAIEFLGEEERWTRVWTRKARPCVSIRAYPFTARGVVALADAVVRYAARRGNRGSPSPAGI